MKKMLALILALMMMASFAVAEEGYSPVGAWEFCGAMLDGAELDEAGVESVLAQYGGVLTFVIAKDGTVGMVQGGGEFYGVWDITEEGTMDIVIDANGTQLTYSCVLADNEGQLILLVTPDGVNYLYFAPFVG